MINFRQAVGANEVIVPFGCGLPAQIRHHIEQLAHLHIIRITTDLRHITDVPAITGVRADGPVAEGDDAAFRHDHAEDAFDERRFTGTVRADNRNRLTLSEADADVFQGLQFAESFTYLLYL